MNKNIIVISMLLLIVANNTISQYFDQTGKMIVSHTNCCKILDKHVALLYEFNSINKKRNIISFGGLGGFPFFLGNFEYKNDILKICITSMINHASLDPLFKTWDFGICTDIGKEDGEFIREFAVLLFSIYENLLVLLTANKKNLNNVNKNTLNEIIELYNIASRIPLRELIVTLERCYILFSSIMRDYGLYSELSWGDWLNRYWWVVPTVTLAFIASLLQRPSFGLGFGRATYGLRGEQLSQLEQEI